MRNIIVCSGIGDNIWLLQKLVNSGEQFNFILPDSPPLRGKQIFDIMPVVAASAVYQSHLSYNFIKSSNVVNRIKRFDQIHDQEFFLECNTHLESGQRIETFLPDLETSYTLDYYTTPEDKKTAAKLLPHAEKNYIGIYMSAYSTIRAWDFWTEQGWLELVKLMYQENKNSVFVIIGASFDIEVATRMLGLLKMNRIPFVDTIGQPLSTVVEVMKKLKYFIGFPSGLSILNETLGKAGFMFYAPHIAGIINAWADPARIESGEYKGAVFCSPAECFKWIRDVYQLFKKIS